MRASRASVLVLALWTLSVLAFLAVAVGGYVSANIKFARHLRQDTTAYLLARAGVELAVAEIINNSSNYVPISLTPLERDKEEQIEKLFKENETLDGGTFSVYFTFYDTNTSVIITNFGVFPESAKINIDAGGASAAYQLQGVLDFIDADASIAGNILSDYPTEKEIAQEKEGKYYLNDRYYFYDGIPELLAVRGINEDVFLALEPLVTIQRFRFGYTGVGPGGKFARDAYGGIAEGQAFTHDAEGSKVITATRGITFVFDRVTTNFLHWREF